jgi:hypothetical protein
VGIIETLVPVLDSYIYPGVEMDMDRIVRGMDLHYPGQTTVGADEVMLSIEILPEAADLPAQMVNCEDREESIMIAIIKRFNGWNDGVLRAYVPESINTWINYETGDTLSMENGGYKTDYYPYFYIERPRYEQSIKFQCLSSVGYFVSESSVCDLLIIKRPEFIEQPENVMSCINSGVAETFETHIYGTYESLQWERRVNNVWTPLHEQTEVNLHLTFPTTLDGATAIKGEYRLRINSYPGYCDLESYYYSNVINVDVGYPLTNYTFATSHSSEALRTGICRGESVWLAAGIPEGDTGTVTGYRWEKYDANIGEFLPISQAVNVTAGMDTFRIFSARTDEDNGLYRCVILGIPVCTEGYSLITDTVEIYVGETAEIVIEPKPVFACIGQDLTTELFAAITMFFFL